ncbi:MAG: hypothetical protein M0Z95_06675 [Actinomycetota bacterium]|nr:hypothetical protein [Actinomycetota bacterium]
MGHGGYPPGWWQASDGNWYPPESHPSYRPPVGPAAQAPPVWGQTPAAQAPPAWGQTPAAQAPPAWGQTPAAQAPPAWGQTPTAGTTGGWDPGKVHRQRPPLPYLVIAGAVLLSVVAYFAVSAIVRTNGLAGIPTGPGSATITWHGASAGSGSGGGTLTSSGLTHTPPQPFNGTIGGVAVSGRATLDLKTVGKLLTPKVHTTPGGTETITLYHWTGTLGGTRFTLAISEVLHLPLTTTSKDAYVSVSGTFGSQPVHAIARQISPASTHELSISGTIGNFSFSGTLRRPTSSDGTSTETATFTLSH